MNPHLLEHPLAIAGLLLAGLYLATAYVVTRSLWLPIFLHTAWNVLEGPVFGLPVSGARPPAAVFDTAERLGAPALWTGGAFGPEASLLLCIVLLAHIGALWGVRSLFSRSPGPAPPLRWPDLSTMTKDPPSPSGCRLPCQSQTTACRTCATRRIHWSPQGTAALAATRP